MIQFQVDDQRCIQCGACVLDCPAVAVGTGDARPQLADVAGCSRWRHCLAACPETAARICIPADHALGYAMAFGEPAVEYHRAVQRCPALVNHVVRGAF